MACLYCTLPLEQGRRWCGKSCYECWRYGTPQRPTNCPACTRTFIVPATHKRVRTYCSRTCAARHHNQTYMTGPNNGRWRGGKVLSYGSGWAEIKARIRARDRVCRVCGVTPEQNGRALGVSHQTVALWLAGRHRVGEETRVGESALPYGQPRAA